MSFKEGLAPKDTEEIRPGLFVQKKYGNYRKINPLVWKGEWRLKNQFSWRNLFVIALVLFLGWSYFSETEFCRQLQKDPCEILPDIQDYCFKQYNFQEAINETQQYIFPSQGDP